MDEKPARQNVTQYRLTSSVAERRIKELAASTENIKWSSHALQRMNEREIFDADALRILRQGTICGSPKETSAGEWKCKMVRRLRGAREAGVVAIILRRGCLLIKTVEWEDLT
jgi:hypothetical protein